MSCQRFNNLPHRYPEQGDLQCNGRVPLSMSDWTILDHYLLVSQTAPTANATAAITCVATRLVDLVIVSDYHHSLPYDVSPIFWTTRLTEFYHKWQCSNICTRRNNFPRVSSRNSERSSVDRAVSNREIEWKHITPFSPWQGGF